MEVWALTLGSVHTQLAMMIDAARRDRTADVVISCGLSVIEVHFDDRSIVAESGRDATQAGRDTPRPEDDIVLQILGWRRDEERDRFVRTWHEDTPSEVVAGDILRTAADGYLCESVELKVLLRVDDNDRRVAHAVL